MGSPAFNPFPLAVATAAEGDFDLGTEPHAAARALLVGEVSREVRSDVVDPAPAVVGRATRRAPCSDNSHANAVSDGSSSKLGLLTRESAAASAPASPPPLSSSLVKAR